MEDGTAVMERRQLKQKVGKNTGRQADRISLLKDIVSKLDKRTISVFPLYFCIQIL